MNTIFYLFDKIGIITAMFEKPSNLLHVNLLTRSQLLFFSLRQNKKFILVLRKE